MPHPRGDGMQEQWPAGDGLHMPVRLDQPNEDAPPVVKQRDHARGEPATSKVLRDEAAPAPLVLQLVENILAIAAIAIQLAKTRELLVERSGENGIFVDFGVRADFDERKRLLAQRLVRGHRQGSLHAPPQYDHAALPAPTIEP